MSKLSDWQAAIIECDNAYEAGKFVFSDFGTYEERIAKAEDALIDLGGWEAIARALLPVALAAEALNIEFTPYGSDRNCKYCGSYYTDPHEQDCTVLKFYAALKELES